jgi:hypothetical protein
MDPSTNEKAPKPPYGYEPQTTLDSPKTPGEMVWTGSRWTDSDRTSPRMLNLSYCRPIDVGAGWRLVMENEKLHADDQVSILGAQNNWNPIFFKDIHVGVTVLEFKERIIGDLLAVRRKVEKDRDSVANNAGAFFNLLSAESLSGRWVPVSEAMPTIDQLYLVQLIDGRVTSLMRDYVDVSIVAKWFNHPPAPPIKSAEDLAFEEAQKEVDKDIDNPCRNAARRFFSAGVAFARKSQ